MNKYNFFNSIFVFIFFGLIFLVPHFLEFYNFGVFLKGDTTSNQINDIKELFEYSKLSFKNSLNIIQNPIFKFFCVAFVYQLILRISR